MESIVPAAPVDVKHAIQLLLMIVTLADLLLDYFPTLAIDHVRQIII